MQIYAMFSYQKPMLITSKSENGQDLIVTVRLSPIALSVAMITSKIWPSYACMTLLSFHCCYIDDFAS